MEIKGNLGNYYYAQDYGILINSELREEIEGYIKSFQTTNYKEDDYLAQLKTPTQREVMQQIANVPQLILSITEQCNFRCKYCSFSGAYENERTHSSLNMDIKTAKRAVDLFLQTINSPSRNRNDKDIYIGFYGGEPLLRFEDIKEIVHYANKELKKYKRKFKLNYRMTSNGTLLNEEILSFLKEHDFSLDISYDGPQEEHDRFRVYANGKGSWADVQDRVEFIKEKEPEFYENKVNFLATLSEEHEGAKIDEWFNGNNDLFPPHKVRYNSVNPNPKFKPKSRGSVSENKKKSIIEDFERKICINLLKTKFDGCCFPGSARLYIDAKGNIHMCERVNCLFPIGNVFEGFYVDKIIEYMKGWNDFVKKMKCWECETRLLCSICFASVRGGKEIEPNCRREGIENYLKRIVIQKEEEFLKQGEVKANSAIELLKTL